MKWISLLALFLSFNVFASKARILAMGEEANYSMWIQDDRSIFKNVSYVNHYKDFAILEFGTSGNGLSLDVNTDPKAQGGVISKIGDFAYGVYLGNENNTSSLQKIVTNSSLSHDDNLVDLFIGSQTSGGLMWGWNFLYASHEEEKSSAGAQEDNKGSAMTTRFGAQKSDWEAYLNVDLKNESENKNLAGDPKYEGTLGLLVGGSNFMDNGFTTFGEASFIKWEQTNSGVKSDGSSTDYKIGLGHKKKITDKLTLHSSIRFISKYVLLKTATQVSLRNNYAPLTFAIESKVKDWLSLRGAIKQNLWGTENNRGLGTLDATQQSVFTSDYGSNGKRLMQNTTDVSAGASLHFGELNIDGLVGTTPRERGSVATTDSEDGVLTTDNLLTRVSVHYKF